MTPPTRRTAVALTAALLLATGACNSGDDTDDTTGTTRTAGTTATTTAETTTTTADASTVTTAPFPGMTPDEIEIRNTLDLYNHLSSKDSENPDPNNSESLDLLTDPYREHMIGVFTTWRDEGTSYRREEDGPPRNQTRMVTFDGPDQATAIECVFHDAKVYRSGNPEPVGDDIGLARYQNTLTRSNDGTWKISDRLDHDETETRFGCRGFS